MMQAGHPGHGTRTTTGGGATDIPISWAGSPWSLTGLSFLNFFLSIITLGIYGFWGRTEVRKRIWSSIHLAGEPLAYTGTGKEMFLGFLMVFGVILVPSLVITVAALFTFGPESLGAYATQFGMAIAFLFLGGVAIYRARRYRMSRTNWRGIRGSLEGSSGAYGWLYFWTMMIVPALLAVLGTIFYFGFVGPKVQASPGVPSYVFLAPYMNLFIFAYVAAIIVWLLLTPWRTTKLMRFITNDMAFGSRPFSFHGSSRPLYLRFIARWVGVLALAIATPTALYFWLGSERATEMATRDADDPVIPMATSEVLGVFAILLVAFIAYSVITAWYKAVEANYFASATQYEGHPFKLSVTAVGLIKLVLVNSLITILTLGILRPVAMARTARYFVENFSLGGPVDVRAIAQSQAAMSKTGEGLAQAFDVDAF